jgi:hypothetical protein
MLLFADAKPLDMLDFRFVQGTLALMAALCAWLAFDTKHALERLIRLTERWNPIPRGSRWCFNPEKAALVWFYRIDAAVVLAGIVYIFVQRHFTR